MAGKYGSASAWIVVDGYDLSAAKVKSFNFKIESKTEPSHGLGDSAEAATPVGVKMASLTTGGGFYDTAANSSHEAFRSSVPTTPQDAQRLVCLGVEGQVLGARFYGIRGAFTSAYEVQAIVGELTKANAEYTVDGDVEPGVLIQPFATKTADWDGLTVDNLAATTNGAAAYLHVKDSTGFTNFVGTVRHSSDDITYVDLVAFDDSLGVAPYKQRKTVAGTVNRYLQFRGDVTGSGSIVPLCGVARL